MIKSIIFFTKNSYEIYVASKFDIQQIEIEYIEQTMPFSLL